jgi:PAS domain S-box-containing protein
LVIKRTKRNPFCFCKRFVYFGPSHPQMSLPALSVDLIDNIHYLQKLVLENVSDIIIITDTQFQVQSWNKIAEEFYGISASTAIGKKMGNLVRFRYNNTTGEQALADLQQHKIWKGEVSFTNNKGEVFYFLQTVKYALDESGKETGILAVGRNITERKRAEEQLQKSEQFYRTLISDSLDVTLLLNATGEITFSTSSIKKLLGYELEEILNTSAFEYVHPEDIAWTFQSFEKEVEEDPEIKFIIVRLLKKDGSWLWCMIRGHNLLDVPSINSIAVYIHDDTPRKKATEALKESEKRFRTLIRELQVGVLIQNAQGEIEMTNDAMCRLFSITESEIIGGRIWKLYTDVIHENGATFLQSERPSFKAIKTGKLVKDVVMGVWHEVKKERIWILVSAEPVQDEMGKLLHVICSFTDITERKRLEEKSLAEKMAHQRQLAQATIDGQENERLEIGKELHDNIGQQLTTVKLFLDLAKTSATEENAEMITMALKGISTIINEIRAVSRTLVPPTLKDFGFIDSVNDLIDSLRHTQALKVELDYFCFDEDNLPENKKLALFRIVQEQLNNIIKHAEAKQVNISLRNNGESILLQINDDGKGFDHNKIRKGLGLAGIISRAELFGGKTEIISSPGMGCQIQVTLPNSSIPEVIG